jgi:hypothetical protein
MGKLRDNLESYVVRSTSELLSDLPEERRDELGGLLSELEGRGARVAEAEERIDELLGSWSAGRQQMPGSRPRSPS